MFQRILVALDGSQRAELALPLAMRLARIWEGTLFLARVVETLSEAGLSSGVGATDLRDIEDQGKTEALEYLAGKTARSEFTGAQMHPIVASGEPASALLEVVRQERIDLVVLCSHGLTGFKRWALGSVAQKVVRQCPVPVLLLRERNMRLNEKVGQPTRVAVALDGSPFAEAALLPAAHLVAALSAPAAGELLLLRVVQMPTGWEERVYRQRGIDVDLRRVARRATDDSLHAARSSLLQHMPEKPGVHITWEAIENGDPAEALLRAAELGKGLDSRRASDLLALTTHGRGGIQRWVLGSVTERVLDGSTLPLLVVHSPELRWNSQSSPLGSGLTERS